MKNTFKLSAFSIAILVMSLNYLCAQSPIGVWKTIDDETGEARSHVEIFEEDGKLHGKIVHLIDPSSDVCNSCTGERHGQKLVGMEILWDMKQKSSEWSGGKIFSPTKDKTYKCKLWLEDDNTLKVRGYVALFYRTQTWYRVK